MYINDKNKGIFNIKSRIEGKRNGANTIPDQNS